MKKILTGVLELHLQETSEEYFVSRQEEQAREHQQHMEGWKPGVLSSSGFLLQESMEQRFRSKDSVTACPGSFFLGFHSALSRGAVFYIHDTEQKPGTLAMFHCSRGL